MKRAVGADRSKHRRDEADHVRPDDTGYHGSSTLMADATSLTAFLKRGDVTREGNQLWASNADFVVETA